LNAIDSFIDIVPGDIIAWHVQDRSFLPKYDMFQAEDEEWITEHRYSVRLMPEIIGYLGSDCVHTVLARDNQSLTCMNLRGIYVITLRDMSRVHDLFIADDNMKFTRSVQSILVICGVIKPTKIGP
jgi:hypothetical protein